MEALNIGQVAEHVGLQASAIRYYENIGLLPSPPRIGGWRRYDASIVERLRVIRAAREMGFTLEEIRLLLEGCSASAPPSESWRTLAGEKLPQVEDMIARANAMKKLLETGLRCECVQIGDCFGDEGEICRPNGTEVCS
jgi:MerR family transcriptional regulator, redox-sensitive transcriptional activator SoxR